MSNEATLLAILRETVERIENTAEDEVWWSNILDFVEMAAFYCWIPEAFQFRYFPDADDVPDRSHDPDYLVVRDPLSWELKHVQCWDAKRESPSCEEQRVVILLKRWIRYLEQPELQVVNEPCVLEFPSDSPVESVGVSEADSLQPHSTSGMDCDTGSRPIGPVEEAPLKFKATVFPLDELPDDATLSSPKIAELCNLDSEMIRGKLTRFRQSHPDDGSWNEIAERRPNEPRYLFRVGSIRELIRKAHVEAHGEK